MPTIDQKRLPKYIELANRIAQDIESGVLKPGDRLPSFSAMAQQFGVASNTADRIFSTLEKSGLVRREVGRGIFVSDQKSSGSTGLIGLTGVALALRDVHLAAAHLAEGIESVTEREDFQLLLLKSSSPIGWDKVDGVFLCEPDAEASLKQLPPNVPCISLLMPLEGVGSVVADDYQGGLEATRHLLGLGHRRIAFLVTHYHPLCQHRLSGYQIALRNAGISPEASWIYEPKARRDKPDNKAWGYDSMRSWLKGNWKKTGCTALVIQNDLAAIGAIEALREAGLAVPEDVSVVGFDGAEINGSGAPRLTTIEIPFVQIGARATELLLSQVKGEQFKQETVTLPVRLRIGETTASPKKAV